MKLVLTSDFPSTTNDVVIGHIRNAGVRPRVAWIPPVTSIGRERLPAAQAVFQSLGVPTLDYCDIDQEPNESQLDGLNQYNVIYLTGGDPLGFRRNIVKRIEQSPETRMSDAARCLPVILTSTSRKTSGSSAME